MTFTAPLGLWSLLAVPVVLWLHLYRRQLRQRQVAALFLFAPELLVASAGRKRTRLLRTASLWLECLAAAALALWLAGLSFGGGDAVHLVAVLDDSASMAAVVDGQSARDRAVAALRSAVAELPGGSRLSLLRSGPRPEVLLGPQALLPQLDDAVRHWQPTQPHHDLGPALELARELAGPPGRVLLLTDAEVPGCDDVDLRRCGVAAGNAAILSAERFTTEQGEHLRAEVRLFGAAAADVTLTLSTAAGPLGERQLALRGGDSSSVDLLLPAGTAALTLHLDDDALALDNVVTLLPEPQRIVPVGVLLPEPLQQALLLPRTLAAQTGWQPAAEAAAAQLLFAPAPGRVTDGRTEVVVAVPGQDRDTWLSPFAVDRSHPWMAGITLGGVAWSAGRGALPGRALVVAGGTTLLSEELLPGGRRLWLSLDPSASNLPRAPDWPILWDNVLAQCRRELPGPVRSNCAVGDEIEWRRALGTAGLPADLELERPDGDKRTGRGLRVVSWRAEQPGLHLVRDAEGRELGRIAVRFHDVVESDLSGASSGYQEARPVPRTAVAAAPDQGLERRLLALLALLCLLLDCLALSRRPR